MPINPRHRLIPGGLLLEQRMRGGDDRMVDTPDALNARRGIAGMRKWDASAINPHGSLIGDEGQPNPSAGLLAPTVDARDQLAMMSRRDQQGSGIGGGGHMMALSASQPPTQETLNELWRRQPTDQTGAMIEHIIRQSGGRLRAPWDDEPQAPPSQGMMRGLMDPTWNR